MKRPEVNYKLNKRECVKFWRACSAWDLAHLVMEEVTEEAFNKAYVLLDKVKNYALADARQWERANTYERYANSQQCKKDEDKLNQRRKKLQQELSGYGVELKNYGLYPSIVKINTNSDLYMLHYYN